MVRRVIALACVLAAARLAEPAGASALPSYRGRPLIEVLEDLRARGVNLVYSTATVGEGLLVTVEPTSPVLRVALGQMLTPLGLTAEDGSAGVVLILRATAVTPGRIAGRVISATRGSPVAGVSVRLDGTAMSTRTLGDGGFRIDAVPPGIYPLRAEAPGYSEESREALPVSSGRTTTVVLQLRPLPTFAEEIVVTPSRRAVSQEDPAAHRDIDPAQALRAPTIGGDVSRVLALLPGVAAADNSAALNVRGGTSRDVSFVLDGLELYEPFHLRDFQSPFSVVDPSLAGTIELSSGGVTVDHGDRHGGFIALATAPPADGSKGRAEIGTMNGRFAFGGPAPSGAVLATARFWYPDAVRDTIELGEDGIDPRFADAYLTYSITSVPQTLLSFHVLAARDRLEFAETDGAEHVESRSRTASIWFRALRSWSDSVSTETVISAGRLERSRHGVSEPEDVALDVDDRREVRFFGLRHDTEVRLSSAHLLRAGLEVRPLDARYDYVTVDAAGTSRIELDPGGTSYAAYLAYRAALTERFAFEAGLRWDRQAYLDDAYLSPRVHAVWRPGRRSELKVSAGRHHQSQRIHELNVPDGQTAFLPAERSDQLDLSFRYRFDAGIELRADAYERRVSGLQPRWENLFDPVELFPETEADRVEITAKDARSRGLELTLQGDPGRRLFWWVSYARAEAVDVEPGRDVPRSWDQPHAARGLLGYRWAGGWTLSVAATVHTGWPTTPVSGRQVAGPGGGVVVEPVLGPRNSDRFPTYARLDLQAGRSFALPRGRLYLRLDVVNATNRENVCCVDDFLLDPNPDGSVRVTPELDDWLGLTPSFGVGWEF